MRIHILNNGLVVESGVSGSDRRAMEWTKIFLREGHKVFLYTPAVGKKRYQNYKNNFSLIIASGFRFFKNVTLFVYLGRAIKTISLLKDVKPGDIIYSTSDLIPDSIPSLVAKAINPQTKLVMGFHLLAPPLLKGFKKVFSTGFDFPSIKNIYYFLSQNTVLFFARRWADLVLVSNNLDRKILIKKGFNPKRVLVTYGAVDWPTIRKAKPGTKRYDASFIGRFHPQKGLNDLLLAWKIISGEKKGVKMAIMGELDPLLPEINKLGLKKNMDFLGFIDGIKKYSVLKSSRVFLFPSTYESFGMVAAEAMACGLPVVAYNLPIYKDIYPKGMVKVPIGDYKKFAEAVLDLLDNKKLRRKLSTQAKELSLIFSWEKTAKIILSKLG